MKRERRNDLLLNQNHDHETDVISMIYSNVKYDNFVAFSVVSENKGYDYKCGKVVLTDINSIKKGDVLFYKEPTHILINNGSRVEIVERTNVFRSENEINPYLNIEFFTQKRIHEYHIEQKTKFKVIWVLNQIQFTIKKAKMKRQQAIKIFSERYDISEDRLKEELARINAFKRLGKQDYDKYVNGKLAI